MTTEASFFSIDSTKVLQKQSSEPVITTLMGRRITYKKADDWDYGLDKKNVQEKRKKVEESLQKIQELQGCPLQDKLHFLKENIHNIQRLSVPLGKGAPQVAEKLFLKAKNTVELFQQSIVADVLQKAKESQAHNQDIDILDEGLSLLSEIDFDSRPAYINIIVDSLYASQRFMEVSIVYKNAILALQQTVEPLSSNATENDLKKWIENHKEEIPAEFLSRQVAMVSYEDATIQSLEPYFSEEKTQKRASPAQIEAFLLHARSNHTLNTRLRSKKNRTPAEDFVLNYTFASIGPHRKGDQQALVGVRGLTRSIELIHEKMNTYGLLECAEKLDSIDETERNMYACYTSLQSYTSEPVIKVKDAIEAFFKEYSNPKYSTVWDARTSTSLLEKAQIILTKIDEVPVTKAQKKLESHLEVIQDQVKLFIETIQKTRESLDKLDQDSSFGIDSTALSTVNVFDTLVDSLEPLAEVCHGFKNCPEIKMLYEDSRSAEKIMHALRTLGKVTHSHHAGDIVLTDEVEKKHFLQRGGIAYSSFSIMKDLRETGLKETKKMFQKALDGQIWTVQPYFTGSRSHARMLFPATMANVCQLNHTTKIAGRGKTKKVRRRAEATGSEVLFPQSQIQARLFYDSKEVFRSPQAVEMNSLKEEKKPAETKDVHKVETFTALYESQDIRTIELTGADTVTTTDISEAMYEVIYRPNFDAILTKDAKTSGISPHEAMSVYQSELKQLVEGENEWKKVQEYKLDQKRATRSFVLSLFPRFMGIKTLAIKIYDYFFGEKGKLRPQVDREISQAQSDQDLHKVQEKINKRFCSELVSLLTREALARTEEKLLQKLSNQPDKKTTPKKIFHEVFPKEMGDDEIYPNLLEKIVSKNNFFTKIGRPSLLQKLFRDVPEAKK